MLHKTTTTAIVMPQNRANSRKMKIRPSVFFLFYLLCSFPARHSCLFKGRKNCCCFVFMHLLWLLWIFLELSLIDPFSNYWRLIDWKFSINGKLFNYLDSTFMNLIGKLIISRHLLQPNQLTYFHKEHDWRLQSKRARFSDYKTVC